MAAGGQLRPREPGPRRSRLGQLRHCGGVRRARGPRHESRLSLFRQRPYVRQGELDAIGRVVCSSRRAELHVWDTLAGRRRGTAVKSPTWLGRSNNR